MNSLPEKANAAPAKEFFIRMLTRDISLVDCILDLLDNSVDGARHTASTNGQTDLHGFYVDLRLGAKSFTIRDNCGGITVANAKQYAFNFGRRKGAPTVDRQSIGIYGIGMKRALFKLGRTIAIHSSTTDESFSVNIDVDSWEKHSDWKFDLTSESPKDEPGTRIHVSDLRSGVGEELVDAAFSNALLRAISRGYTILLDAGLKVFLNGKQVQADIFSLRAGGEFVPVRTSYRDKGVSVEIIAGMMDRPPDDDSAEAHFPHYRNYGWYVVGNDRVILAGDKTSRTVWGNDRFNAWHNQYNGFLGVVYFHSESSPDDIPWTTTKRDIDLAHPIYRRALARMKKATKPFIDYTNARKDQIQRLADAEQSTTPIPISEIGPSEEMKVPTVKPLVVEMGNVLYRLPRVRLLAAAEALGNRNFSYRAVGLKTFEYFCERELPED